MGIDLHAHKRAGNIYHCSTNLWEYVGRARRGSHNRREDLQHNTEEAAPKEKSDEKKGSHRVPQKSHTQC